MKKSNLSILAALFVCSLSASAFAGDPGMYAAVSGGLIVPSDVEISKPGNSADASRKVGYTIGGAVGFDFGTNVRAEAEINYKANDTNELKEATGTKGYTSTISALSFMANAYYDLHSLGSYGVMPYVGAGVGVARLSTNDGVIAGGTTFVQDGSDTVLAYQAGLGVAYTISPKALLDVGYRYFRTADAKFKDPSANVVTMTYDNHTILAGLRFLF